MEDSLKAYLKKQLGVIVHKGPLEDSDIDPTSATSYAIERIKTCQTSRNCVDYMADDLGITWTMISEAYIVNFCCEPCGHYKPKKENKE